MRELFLVSERRGGPWDWSKGLGEQEQFDEHGEFMDRLVDEGFVVLGGPLDERHVLLVVESETEAAVLARFELDPVGSRTACSRLRASVPGRSSSKGGWGRRTGPLPTRPGHSPHRPSLDTHRQ